MMSKPRQLRHQVWPDWLRMAEKSLAGAGRIAWQSEAERQVEIDLFAKVTGWPPMDESRWQNSMTWAAAALLGLSVEQGLKALIIRRSECAETPASHDLVVLWEDLPQEDHRGIAEEAARFRTRTAGTRFGDSPDLSKIEALIAMIRFHRHVFEHARYHLESPCRGPLEENLGLWVVAVSTYVYGKRLMEQDLARRHVRS